MLNIDKTPALMRNINIRKERHGDEVELGADINLEVNLPLSILEVLAVDQVDWKNTFWSKDGIPLVTGVTSIKFGREFENIRARIWFDGEEGDVTLRETKIKKISAAPQPGSRVMLTLQIQCAPSAEDVAMLTEAYLDDIHVALYADRVDIEDQHVA